MIHAEKVARFFTGVSPELVNRAIISLARNRAFYQRLVRSDQKRLKGLSRPDKILVVPDINIGDALILQTFIQRIKHYFPEFHIHYIYQQKAFPLIKNNPHIEIHSPVFRGKGIPAPEDTGHLSNLLKKNRYDLIFNFCPYFSPGLFRPAGTRTIHPIRLMADIIRGCTGHDQKAHFVYHAGHYADDIAQRMLGKNPLRNTLSRHQTFFFADRELVQRTEKAIRSLKIEPAKTTVLFNPDSASLYTFIPFALQLNLLKGILSLETVGQLWMNCGRTFKHIEKSILNSLPDKLKKKVVIIPENIPIDVYAALADHAEIFISGDTGPMHIAAARKILLGSSGYFNNSTALIGIFGATSSKIYGYDSFSAGHVAPSQDAPAKVFEGHPDCKNLTCINKIYKKCKRIRCFEGLDANEIVRYIESYLFFLKTASTPVSAGTFNPFNDIKNQWNPEEEKSQKKSFPFPECLHKFVKLIKP
jgi:ADP-heptose:LPS heptosyltransferase